MRIKSFLATTILLFVSSFLFGQMEEFSFKKELKGVFQPWHKVALPNSIFEKVAPNLNDIRVYGITEVNDTIEASYLLQIKKEKKISKDVNFEIINTSSAKNGYYFTFQVANKTAINELKLEFNRQNFDWKLKIEGSQNLQEWFTIVDDYRILSIKNSETEYQFTDIIFPKSKYQYYRICVKSNLKPNLIEVKMISNEIEPGVFENFVVEKIEINQLKKDKKTEIEVDLTAKVPVSSIKINIKGDFDYYRKVKIQYLLDSIHSEKGWKYKYKALTNGMLSSIDNNEFKFESTILKKLKITIYNFDNEPLKIDSVLVKGYNHDLTIRFTERANYYLTYGNTKAKKPNYEISKFVSKIPDSLTYLKLGNEKVILKKEDFKKEPLFKNKNWLWAIMVVIIGVLGWFSLRMIKSKP